MKALSIQQPWASLICAGVKDVENRTWKTSHRGKLLIHVSGTKTSIEKLIRSQPIEYIAEIMNQSETFGQLPLPEEMPVGAIIGYVDVVDCIDDSKSDWAAPGQYHFILKNAHLFDEPIMGVKGQLHLFDYPIDEKELPSSRLITPRNIKLESGTLVIPVQDVNEYTENEKEITESIQLSFGVVKEALNSNGSPKKIKSVRYEDLKGNTLTYNVKEISLNLMVDGNNNFVPVYSFYSEDKVDWEYLNIELSK